MGKADLEPGEVLEDPAHEKRADSSGCLCRHSHQSGQPVLGHSSPHLHVPGMHKEHSPEILRCLVDRVELLGIQVPVPHMGTYLETWEPQVHCQGARPRCGPGHHSPFCSRQGCPP